MVKTQERILPTSRLSLVPFIMQYDHKRVLFGRADGTNWIDFDLVGANVIEYLNQGLTIQEVQGCVTGPTQETIDVLSFVRDLDALGFVATVVSSQEEARQSKVPAQSVNTVEPYWEWSIFSLSTIFATLYLIWSMIFFPLSPLNLDVVIPSGFPLLPALAMLVVTTLGLVTIHETAHLLIARYYGLASHIRFSRRGLSFVVETDLTSVWRLKRKLRWRPIAAGLMIDLNILAFALLLLHLKDLSTPLTACAHVVIFVLLAKMFWQCQWYLRTDIYYLVSVVSGSPHLRQSAWSLGKALLQRKSLRDTPAFKTLSQQEQRVVIGYLFSLPLATLATGALLTWLFLPFAHLLPHIVVF